MLIRSTAVNSGISGRGTLDTEDPEEADMPNILQQIGGLGQHLVGTVADDAVQAEDTGQNSISIHKLVF